MAGSSGATSLVHWLPEKGLQEIRPCLQRHGRTHGWVQRGSLISPLLPENGLLEIPLPRPDPSPCNFRRVLIPLPRDSILVENGLMESWQFRRALIPAAFPAVSAASLANGRTHSWVQRGNLISQLMTPSVHSRQGRSHGHACKKQPFCPQIDPYSAHQDPISDPCLQKSRCVVLDA